GNTGDGVLIQAPAGPQNQVGGLVAGARNVISKNTVNGVKVDSSNGNLIQGNFIGTDRTGAVNLGNTGKGVLITNGSAGNKVKTNKITFNAGAGVAMSPNAGVGNKVADPNSIFANGGIGIDLGDNGVTLNNSAGHVGPNNYQNFPVLT